MFGRKIAQKPASVLGIVALYICYGSLAILRFPLQTVKAYAGYPRLVGKTFIQLYVWTKKRLETRATLGNRRSLCLLWFPCDATVPFTNARVGNHGAGAAARQKSKDPLDFWMKVWTKVIGRFSSTGAGFRGFSIQKSKNPKK